MKSTTEKKDTTDKKQGRKISNPLVFGGTIVILIITVIAFVIIPAYSSAPSSGGGGWIFGYWKNKPIQFTQQGDFANEVTRIKDYYSQQGYLSDSNPYIGYQIWNQAYQNTLVTTALKELSESYGFRVSKDYVSQEVTKSQYFQENGKFSLKRYQDATYAIKLSLYQDIEQNTIRGRFINSFFNLQTSSQERAFIKAMGQKTREIEYVSLPLSLYPDSERLAFAEKNPEPFRRIKLSRITLTGSESEAKNIVSQLESGKLDFAAAAKQYSQDAYKDLGGDMGWKYYWELRADFKDTKQLDELLTYKAGTVSSAIPSSTGTYIIFKVMEETIPGDPVAQDFIKSISDYMNSYERGTMEAWLIAQGKAFAEKAAATSFAAEAQVEKLEVKTSNSFPLNYGNALVTPYFPLLGTIQTDNTPELSQASSNEQFLISVWSLAPGAVSEPVLLGSNVLVFRVKAETIQEPDSLSMIDTFYGSIIQQNAQTDIINWILASPYHKNNFYKTYSKLFNLNG